MEMPSYSAQMISASWIMRRADGEMSMASFVKEEVRKMQKGET